MNKVLWKLDPASNFTKNVSNLFQKAKGDVKINKMNKEKFSTQKEIESLKKEFAEKNNVTETPQSVS